MSAINFNHVYTTAYCEPAHQAKPLGFAFDMGPYLVPVSIEFFTRSGSGDIELNVFGEKETTKRLAILDGMLVLGNQIFHDRRDIFIACDDHSADLGAAVVEADGEFLLEANDGSYRNILYIDSIEMSSFLIEVKNVRRFYDLLPQVVFERYNLMPELMCYLVADAKRYYATARQRTRLDPRSVDGFSPLLYTENGYSLSDSGKLLYSVTEGFELPIRQQRPSLNR